MEELAVHPAVTGLAAAQLHAILEDLLAPFWIFAEVGDDFVIFVEKRYPGAEVGDEENVFVGVEVRRKNKAVEGLEMFACEREPLEAFVGAIRNDDGRLGATIVDGDAMGGIELAVAFARFAKH